MNRKHFGIELFHYAPDTGTAASSSKPGTRADNPVSLSKTCVLTEENWNGILDEIEKSNLFTALDLSACTKSAGDMGGGLYSDGTINPQSGNDRAKEKIVSIVLPDEAVIIPIATSQRNTVKHFLEFSVFFDAFKNFKNLKSISGLNVKEIGDRAFLAPPALAVVDFPKVTNIGAFAFANCALTEADYPEVIIIDISAFEKNETLARVNFPKCFRIGNNAFKDCKALVEMDFSSAVTFGYTVFSNIESKALTIKLGNTAPYLWGNLFGGISEKITITVKIPPKATGYGVDWKDSLKAGNDKIDLVIEELP
jgi:hypothetical protein